MEVDAEHHEARNHSLVYEENLSPEEASQLRQRKAVFPLEVAEPQRATFFRENGDVFLTPIHGLIEPASPNRGEPLPHGLDRII